MASKISYVSLGISTVDAVSPVVPPKCKGSATHHFVVRIKASCSVWTTVLDIASPPVAYCDMLFVPSPGLKNAARFLNDTVFRDGTG